MSETEPPARPTIGVDVRPGSILVRMCGDLDVVTAPRLDRVLEDVILRASGEYELSGAPSITIALEAVDLISAAGMTVLLRACGNASRHGVECLVCVSPRARRALALTGLDRVLLTGPRRHRVAWTGTSSAE
ncbi:STAS domain-containing protein [Actinomycetospora termitidis]|uniref:STAS domain-containing protein n=1 Tax=Actinomycetospora termitidis TaxID=3053470 RepID=A0ABT7MGR4_9PSEU|nr:STAS domain-containing protein [Actinomycetospora sp. Odt1-22]MDL5159877.1 STAS domain-containing protein [Actinomycetospora sp. Odt1-22]